MINTPPFRDEWNGVGWQNWIMQVFNACFAVYQSGETAGRPTKGLWIGRPYFDTDLGTPIWYDANGSTGWCDSAGSAV